jgi:ABC-type uncharacterized transport system ATPase subunit
MVGREIVLNVDKAEVPEGETVFAAEDITAVRDDKGILPFEHVSLEVKKGEILAITGVAGNGQGPLVSALCGLSPFGGGTIRYRDGRFDARTWGRVDKQDIVYIPEDRHHTASVGDLSLTENFMLTQTETFSRGPLVNKKSADLAMAAAIAHFNIHTPEGPASMARQLSGGNLQKMILARELSRKPALIIAEHPTHGLDVGATEEIWQAILKQREHAGILLVSGDLKEVLSLADRVAVMFRGHILKTIRTNNSDDVSQIGLLMAGVTDGKLDGTI